MPKRYGDRSLVRVTGNEGLRGCVGRQRGLVNSKTLVLYIYIHVECF